MVALSLMLKSAVLLGSAQQLSIPVVVAASAIPPLTDTQVECFQLQVQYQVGVLFKCLMEAHSVAGPVFVWIVLMG